MNTGTKLRGAKNSEIQGESEISNDAQRNDLDNILFEHRINNLHNPRGTLVIYQRNSGYSDHGYSRFKPRNSGSVTRNEFRMARGGSSSDRGRGGTPHGRGYKKSSIGDRDINSDHHHHQPARSKFQESLKNHENSTKYYDDKRTEDSRISKLIRRLCREEDYDHFMGLCRQVQEALTAAENQRYVKRNVEGICESLLNVLHTSTSSEAKQSISKCLGRVGYTVDQDFRRYMDWIFNKYNGEQKNDVKCVLMKSFVETLQMDMENPKLKEFSTSMMSQLQSTLENVDKADLLMSTVDAILLIIDSYPETFSNHFRDTVDILVGWHIDSTKQKSIVTYASRSLQKLRSFWIADLPFTLTLLGQFIEDMESYDEELNLPRSGSSSPPIDETTLALTPILRITSLISVFNTVTKSISDHLNPSLSPNVQWSFLTDCLSKMLKTVVKAIEFTNEEEQEEIDKKINERGDPNVNDKSLIDLLKTMIDLKYIKNYKTFEEKEELIVVANECACLILGYLQSRVTKNHDLLYKFIDLQLERVDVFWDDTIVSMLNTISKVIKEVSANLPLELVHRLLGERSALLKLRFRQSLPIQNASLGVYHSLLSLKNIPLLQESYRYILADLEIAYKLILNDIDCLVQDNPLPNIRYKKNDAEIVITFILCALSDLANASNSIIGMWALKPSILELLAVKLEPYNPKLSSTIPYLQYSILYLLCAHCSRYNHFVSSSNLITGPTTCRPLDIFPGTLDVPTTSPTSGHLSIILNLISKAYSKETSSKTLLLLSSWLQEIYIQADNYLSILSKTKECENIVTSLLDCGSSTNNRIASSISDILELLLNGKNVTWSKEIYSRIVDLATLHLTSNDDQLREKYQRLLIRVPLDVVILKLNAKESNDKTKINIENYNRESLILAQRLYMRGNNNNIEMQGQHFKTYMAFLLQQYQISAEDFSEILTLSWPTINDSKILTTINELALANRSFLFFWTGYEAAQYCVVNKLRTPLGKPQETFTTIEGALKMLAREISNQEKKDLIKNEQDHTRVRLFVEFLEHLERAIYNAGEGCAVALSAPSKPVRNFFYTNKSTCKEWLNRIRLALCVVSLNSGLATNALRNGEKLLEDMNNTDNNQGIEFERTVLCTAEAMVVLGESEALQGLYVYCKDKDRKFSWLKAAIDESSGRYELASDHYRTIIEEYKQQDNNHNQQVLTFCKERLCKCYRSLGDWKEDDHSIMESLTNWNNVSQWSLNLRNTAVDAQRLDRIDDNYWKTIEQCETIGMKSMEEGLRNTPCEYLNDAILLQYSSNALKNCSDGFRLSRQDKMKNIGSNVLTQILWWLDYLSKIHNKDNEIVNALRLDVVRSARKDGNFKLAQREIWNYFRCENLIDGKEIGNDVIEELLNNNSLVEWSTNNMRAFRELSKLLYGMDKTKEALKVCSVTALGISQSIVNGEQSNELRETGSKLLMTVGKWIQQDIQIDYEDNTQLEELLRFEALHNDGLMDKLFGQTTELIPHSDIIVGKLMQLGVNQCPDLPLAWSSFAAWCYKWGRKIVDNSNSGQLTDTDKLNVQSLLPIDISEVELNDILTILNERKSISEDEGDIDTNVINTSETIENQLRNVDALRCASNEHLSMLVDIWRQAQKRIYSYYELSANAYFKYLQLAGKGQNDSDTITATLRVLRLVVKHALELQNVLESGLSSTPTGPWKEIIPQLFSRLSHPECYVRTRVSELLCRIAENSPHLITFPAVVGAVSACQKKTFDENEEEEKEDDDDLKFEQEDENESFMNTCFLQLVDCLSNRIQDSLIQVKVLVKELRRITLLWDELWLVTLGQHHTEISKRFEQLETEVQKVKDNHWLNNEEKEQVIAEKYRIILKPIIFILENLLVMTSVNAKTPYEKNFQKKFGPVINDVINRMKNPQDLAKPQTIAAPLKQLEQKLAQRVQKRSAYSLLMSDISPVLANLKNTSIAMPGFTSIDERIVTIKSVDNSVQILPTKTKPKKLIFHGSDGHVYTYLFKGLEDLHLDERIMQFLSICNSMMSKSADTKSIYRARHYSVIPLGPRSGLIQWVDGVTPLFLLYKRWQQRESFVANKTGHNSVVLRPSELFYNKLAPLLKERSIGLENRKEWPVQVLKQVLAELMNETPKDLLAREIWCNSINAGSWWQATKNYSYSVAVMSVIGYIIGLGDRHLDNVLVDLNTGEVVHIDYNVCFEKGKTLRVPEKVPFRMTPNIKTALGVTGVEGMFRLACEHTLRVMRRGGETLLTLLEAFVYDPLVDWRAGGDNSIASYGACQARAKCTGIGRKQLEQELTRAMFTVRITEIRSEWFANRDELMKSLPLLCRYLICWLETTEASRQCQDLLQDRHQQLGLVKEAQAMGRNHALYSVVKRYNTFKRAKDSHETAKTALKEKKEECEKQMNMHQMALNTVKGPQLGSWLSELDSFSVQNDQGVFDLVKEFLQNAGQSQMIIQCEQSENELTQLANQQSLLIRSCLDLLTQYSAICSFYPQSILSQHRTIMYHDWAENLLRSGKVESCRQVQSQLESTNLTTTNNPQQIVTFSYQMQTILNECNEKFKKSYDRMLSEGLPESIGRIEKSYTESKLQINGFLRREKGGEKALECVNVTALCALNKRYLMMEGAAKCAGDCLVDLTSREGDWFLDEMRFMSSLIAELVTFIPENHKTNNDPQLPIIMKCLKNADSIYKGLQELNFNFHTIILPEAIKTIITEEPSVVRMINELNEIILTSGVSLNEILNQLEIHLRFTVMEMDSPHDMVQNLVQSIRLRFDQLLSRPAEFEELNNHQEETLTPGQMLLMGFNGLFDKLQLEGNALITSISTLDIPLCWRKIDQIREAKEMSAPIFNETARQVLEDIFLIKRLNTIQEFFTMCRDIATAFKATTNNNSTYNIYDDERLGKPVKVFTADYVSRQLLGVTSQTLAIALCSLLQRMGLNVTNEIEQRDIGAESKVSIEELCRKCVDLNLKRGYFSTPVLSQASALSSTLESAWRRKQSSKLAQQSVEIARARVQRLQILLTAHHWLHEDYLSRSNINPIVNRGNFMLELRKTCAGLTNLQTRVCEAREQQRNLINSAAQRLKWAAGANPALAEVMSAFDNAVLISDDKLTRQHNLSSLSINTCNSILHYEAFRTRTSESLNHDNNMIKLMKRWEESCNVSDNLPITVTAIEESLLDLLKLEMNNVDTNWLKLAENIVSEAILNTQKTLQDKQEILRNTDNSLKERTTSLQNLLTEHHRLMSEVRSLLKNMAQQEDTLGLQQFLMDYRNFTENITGICKELETPLDLDSVQVVNIKTKLDDLIERVPGLYNELIEFSMENNKSHFGAVKSPRKTGLGFARDPTTGKAVQERNAYALNVWRRVRMKLEGRDPYQNRKLTTAEQIEYIIKEALSTENLALLYEGWTPWV